VRRVINPTTTVFVLKAIAGCYSDSGSRCMISKKGGSAWALDGDAPASASKVRSIGEFRYFELQSSNAPPPLDLEVNFGGTPKSCTVNPTSGINGPRGYSEGELTGFSSDASGLVSTGVWRITNGDAGAQLNVPSDFIVSGGGFKSNNDAFISEASFGSRSASAIDPRLWSVFSSTRSLTTPSRTTAYAVGLRIHGLSARDLNNLVGLQGSTSSASQPQTVPSVSDYVAPGRVILGGGFYGFAVPSQFRWLFVTATAPTSDYIRLQCSWLVRLRGLCLPPAEPLKGWYAQSTSVSGNITGSISLKVLSMLGNIYVDGKLYRVRGQYLANSSSPGYQSTAIVQGMRGDYAITSAGAATLCQRFSRLSPACTTNDLLTEVVPMLDEGGAKASATHMTGMGIPSTGSVTAYVNGIKLEPIGSP